METVLDARLRWLRALLVGSVAFFLGTAGHVMANGLLPGPVGLTALFVLSTALALPVLGRRVSSVRTVALLVGGQTFIHLCLTLTAGHVGQAPTHHQTIAPTGTTELPVVDGRRIGSLQDAFGGTYDGPVSPAVPSHLISDLQAHAPMMVVHLLAAALVGLWLAHGERLALSVVTLTGHRLLALVRVAVPVAVPAVSRATYAALHAPAGPVSVWLARPDSRRGPPLVLA